MTVNVWEQGAGNGRLFPWRTNGRCSALAHPHPPGSLSAVWVPLSFPRRLGGAVSSPQLWLGRGQDSDGENRQTGRETYQIVPKRGKSLFAFQEGLPYAGGGLHMTKLDTELCALFR